jgi:hypothetical protein
MMTLNQLAMLKVVPRGRFGACVPTAVAFITGANYFDVEDFIRREQPDHRPDIKSGKGVYTDKLFGKLRVLFGHQFLKMPDVEVVGSLHIFVKYHNDGDYLVCNRNHAYVVRNGQVFDGRNDTFNYPIRDVWKVRKVDYRTA